MKRRLLFAAIAAATLLTVGCSTLDERERIEADLVQAGFSHARIDTVTARSPAASAREVAIAYCQGTPWRGEIEARGGPGLEAATDAATEELERRFGAGPVDGKIQAHVITVTR